MFNCDFKNRLSFMYWIDVYDSAGVSMSGARSIGDAERNFNMSIKRCKPTDNKVVMTHDGTIFTGKSRYQAEQALNYLKNNFPSYTNFRIFGTGEWDDPYAATMEKTLKIYDVRSKQIYNMVVDDEK